MIFGVSLWYLTAEAGGLSLPSPFDICSGKSGTEKGFSFSYDFCFPPVSIIPLKIHTHFHLNSLYTSTRWWTITVTMKRSGLLNLFLSLHRAF
jgi:hypothetical protein